MSIGKNVLLKNSAKAVVSPAHVSYIKKWAVKLCADQYCLSKSFGGTVAVNQLVQRMNNGHLRKYHGVRISSANVWRSIYSRKIEENSIDQECNSEPSTYLYFQRMNTKYHTLRIYVDNERKLREPLSEIDKISEQVNVLPTSRYIYCKTDLHEEPHGSQLVSKKYDTDVRLHSAGIPNTTIVKGDKSGEVDLIEDWGLGVWYESHKMVKTLNNATEGEDSLLSYALKNESGLVVDKSRNSCDDSDAINRRIRFGVGQNQPETNTKYRSYDVRTGEADTTTKSMNPEMKMNCPTINADAFHAMDQKAKDFMKDVAALGKHMMKRFHGNKVLVDKERNSIFSGCLNKKLGWRKNHAYFEYYDIQIMSWGVRLDRHMDYKNDSRDNFNHACVYSFFRNIDSKEYKVSIVMTTRCNAGSAMETFRSNRDN